MNFTPDIQTTAKIPVRKEVKIAFRQTLENELAGSYDRRDIKYLREIIADIERHRPQEWTADTKQEYIYFLTSCAEIYAEQQGITVPDREPVRPDPPVRGGWSNPASARNGKKGSRPKRS